MFKLVDTNRFPLKGTNGKILHLATITKGVREFVFIMDQTTSKTYLEEVTGGRMEWIDDDSLHEDLSHFVEQVGLNKFVKAT